MTWVLRRITSQVALGTLYVSAVTLLAGGLHVRVFPGHFWQSEYPVLVAYYGEIIFTVVKHVLRLFYGEIIF